DEDLENLGSIQASMQSNAFPGLRLSYQERRIYWTHEEIDRRIGIDRIPEHLRVRPMLADYVEQTATEEQPACAADSSRERIPRSTRPTSRCSTRSRAP